MTLFLLLPLDMGACVMNVRWSFDCYSSIYFFRFSLLIAIISQVLNNNRNEILVSGSFPAHLHHSFFSVLVARAKKKDMMYSHDDRKEEIYAAFWWITPHSLRKLPCPREEEEEESKSFPNEFRNMYNYVW